MRAVVFCATFAAIAFPAAAGAQSVTLTESDALARLSADSPRVRAMRAGIDIARVDVLTAAIAAGSSGGCLAASARAPCRRRTR